MAQALSEEEFHRMQVQISLFMLGFDIKHSLWFIYDTLNVYNTYSDENVCKSVCFMAESDARLSGLRLC